MRFIYFGSSTFSRIVLETIFSAGFSPYLVITKPDAPQGRGLKVYPTQVSEFCKKHKIKELKPESLREKSFSDALTNAKPDFIVVADYGKIFPPFLLLVAQKMPLGVHPSLLPLYRGAAPIEQSLIKGEKVTGVTIFKLNQKVDSGPIILQKKLRVDPKDNYLTLQQKLACAGGKALVETFAKAKNNQIKLLPQNNKKATFAPKLTKKQGHINWQKKAKQIENLIRATLEWPTAYAFFQDKILKITDAEAVSLERKEAPSTVIQIDKNALYVATASGALKINKVKPAGKNEMSAWAFACGHKIKKGDTLT